MEEKYYLYDILADEKSITVNMATSLNEASSDHVYNIYFDMFKQASKNAKDLFNLAYNKGWYTLEEEDVNKISTACDKLNEELNNCI